MARVPLTLFIRLLSQIILTESEISFKTQNVLFFNGFWCERSVFWEIIAGFYRDVVFNTTTAAWEAAVVD